jgi:hypothetical protein
VRAFAHLMHVESGRSLYVPASALPWFASRPDVAMYAPSFHSGHGHIHRDRSFGESPFADQPTVECHHTHAPGCSLYNPEDESFLHSLAVTILESDLFARLRDSSALSGHGVPRQAQADSRPESE